MTKKEIETKYLFLHDALGSRKDTDNKELFDQQHAEVWHNCDIELQARMDELKAKATKTKDEDAELAELIVVFPKPLLPVRDLIAELDALKVRIEKLEKIK